MVEHYNSNIQNIILRELFKAQFSIKIAVAWFTNDLLFQPLLLKLQTGVSVSLVTNHDEINFSEANNIDFAHFANLGGELHLNNTKTLMHDKFCVIDDSVVISGTYNWTNKAEHNDESVMLIRADNNLVLSYMNLFQCLIDKYPSSSLIENIKRKDKKESQIDILDTEPFCNMAKADFIKISEDNETPEYAIIQAGQYINLEEHKYYLSVLDYQTLEPILPYEYTDSGQMNTQEGTIWLRKNNRYALFNVRLKKFLTSFSFTYITNLFCSRNYYIVKINAYYGVCNCKGEIVIPCEYDNIDNKRGITEKNGKYGVICSDSVILPPICDTINLLDGKPSKVGEKYGLLSDGGYLDSNGQRISRGKPALDFIYDEIRFHGYIDYEIGNFYVIRQGNNYGLYVPYKGIMIPCNNDRDKYAFLDFEFFIQFLHHKFVSKYKK